ncbi:hypothetical protein B0A55_04474 [Friedmanniomyces simplex]|uniref:Thioester reductase (TE) domain-containing protein n=1 Tax=Friedmanniomyces simplex TaxID=329884 RepID=A0A4U0XEW2_9PEZI|nr:hypothetical protein B0A55_04474 [Friedmanniomyces simplex]
MNGSMDELSTDRRVILPRIIEDLGRSDPEGKWVTIPRQPGLKHGWRDVTYGELAKAVNGLARWGEQFHFNKTLECSESVHIAGTRRCVDFSFESQHRAHIIFISSISSVANWFEKHADEPEVPEQLLDDPTLPSPSGYGESKHVAGLILSKAAVQSGQEWITSLVITLKALGILPDQLGRQDVVPWVPMDLAAKTVLEIAEAATERSQQGGLQEVAPLVNPAVTSWSKVVHTVCDALQEQGQGSVEIVSFERWLQELNKVPHTQQQLASKPTAKLLDFYESLLSGDNGLPRLSTHQTALISKTLSGMKPIDEDFMPKWVRGWENA